MLSETFDVLLRMLEKRTLPKQASLLDELRQGFYSLIMVAGKYLNFAREL